jgi:hypothetical protein
MTGRPIAGSTDDGRFGFGSWNRFLRVFVPAFFVRGVLVDLLRRREPRARYRDYKSQPGMSRVHD